MNGSRARLAMALLALAIFPLAATHWGQAFYVGFASRIMIYAIAASSLNLILGYGGMVSFGHAAYLGVGAYAAGICMQAGLASAWLAWPLAVLSAGAVAALVGAICLRTRGVYFIMITLAFAQMLYYVFVSLRSLGGEDGFTLPGRASIGFGLDPKNDVVFYYVVAILFVATLVGLGRLVRSRFGVVLEGIRENETRMQAIGFATYRHKLIAFTIAGALAGLAGALLASQNTFVSPALLQWSASGTLMIMVIVGGVGRLSGGAIGALVYLVLEEALAARTVHWQFALGAVLLAVVLFAKQGLAGSLSRWFSRKEATGG